MNDLSLAAQLCIYGQKLAERGLVAGAGGNISVRDQSVIWMKPSGYAMDELTPELLAGIDVNSGQQVAGVTKPTSEVNMHLAIYQTRPEVQAVFHTHSPWACGVLASGTDFQPMFAEFVGDLGGTVTIPYVTPTTQKLADAVCNAVKLADTIFMRNHGVCAIGKTLKQAYYRVWVVEDAAKSLVAAKICGNPVFLTQEQIAELESLPACQHRTNMMEKQA